MPHSAESIAEKWARIDPAQHLGVFGADAHGMRLRPPIAPAALERVEARYGVRLPEAYRDFLLHVGDGGAGPYYGLIPLERAVCVNDFAPGAPTPAPEDWLATPFPHVAAYNPDTDPAFVKLGEDADARRITEAEWERACDRLAAGTLVLSHEGCGWLHLLVVTGPTRGQVWVDGRTADLGFTPLGVDFGAWYERWLDGLLERQG